MAADHVAFWLRSNTGGAKPTHGAARQLPHNKNAFFLPQGCSRFVAIAELTSPRLGPPPVAAPPKPRGPSEVKRRQAKPLTKPCAARIISLLTRELGAGA